MVSPSLFPSIASSFMNFLTISLLFLETRDVVWLGMLFVVWDAITIPFSSTYIGNPCLFGLSYILLNNSTRVGYMPCAISSIINITYYMCKPPIVHVYIVMCFTIWDLPSPLIKYHVWCRSIINFYVDGCDNLIIVFILKIHPLLPWFLPQLMGHPLAWPLLRTLYPKEIHGWLCPLLTCILNS